MIILGLTGGLDNIYENRYHFTIDFAHDTAAVLVEDGKVVAGVEEERLVRIKHTNKTFTRSIKYCLRTRGIGLEDVDYIAYYATEEFLNEFFRRLHLEKPALGAFNDIRTLMQDLFEREFGVRPAREKFKFVSHHMAHVVSIYAMCGFENALVFSADGVGESVSTMILDGRGNKLDVLLTKPQLYSLGNYYTHVIQFLGYAIYDEYKVMGLAPYGDPARFRDVFKNFYILLPNGDYLIYPERILELYSILTPRAKAEPFSQLHKDIAATLQESLEVMVFHILTHYREITGHEYLVMAGGVAHNSTLNGKLLSSGLFRDVFIQPAADDAGCAVGCALAVAHTLDPTLPRERLAHVYWGPDAGSDEEIRASVNAWDRFVSVRRLDNVSREVARLMADGSVIGWIQGCTEFGPRALGNRSIIADPRPAEHKDVINAMIKKREAYRPFAPSVLEERVSDFFEVPGEQTVFPFMSFVLKVREEHRAKLGAITHVDGSSRLQTVSRATNPKYWELIHAFGEITGYPIVLNTSFNNNVEPIVNTVDDGMVCFLTSGLNYFVAGDCLAKKKSWTMDDLATLYARLPDGVRLVCEQYRGAPGRTDVEYRVMWNYAHERRSTLSVDLYNILKQADGKHTVGEIMREMGLQVTDNTAMQEEFFNLWQKRFIVLNPHVLND